MVFAQIATIDELLEKLGPSRPPPVLGANGRNCPAGRPLFPQRLLSLGRHSFGADQTGQAGLRPGVAVIR